MADIFGVIESRRSAKVYDPNLPISREELVELLEIAGKAPSAWNLQHWHFMIFDNKEIQQRILPIAYNQQQIVDASAVIAVLGDLEANKNAELVFTPDVEAGMMTPEIKNTLIQQIEGAYQNKQYARDAAFSNASLAAMQFMLAAKAKGWDTCPIGGFNPVQFMKEFNVSDRYVPVMLITIGKAIKEPRKSNRLDIHQLITEAK
jgi:nitroreductase